MRRELLLFLPLVLAGCQTPTSAVPPSAPVPNTPRVAAPASSLTGTEIGLVAIDRPSGEARIVTVGMPADEAFRAFPRKGGFEYEDIPAGFADSYRARHWEDGNRQGFGVILFENRVVSAMLQEDNVSVDRVESYVRYYEGELGVSGQKLLGTNLSYWFWERKGQRLMICAAHREAPGIQLTVAIGTTECLDALGASPNQARNAIKLAGPSDKSSAPLK